MVYKFFTTHNEELLTKDFKEDVFTVGSIIGIRVIRKIDQGTVKIIENDYTIQSKKVVITDTNDNHWQDIFVSVICEKYSKKTVDTGNGDLVEEE